MVLITARLRQDTAHLNPWLFILIKLCKLSELAENQSKGFSIDGLQIFAVKKSGKVVVYKNSCPHLGIQLEMVPDQFLDTTHSLIQCSMHGALFRIEDGLCISGPCFDQHLDDVPFEIKDDALYLKPEAKS